jgi:hypothetical protein
MKQKRSNEAKPPEEIREYIPKSVSWHKDTLRDITTLAEEKEKETRRPFNFSAFVNDAVVEKMQRAKLGGELTPIQAMLRKELTCLLDPQQRRSA